MKEQIRQEFKDVADILQGWERGHNLFGYDEALVWRHKHGIGIALRGDALKIEMHVFELQMFRNEEHYLDSDMQRQFFGNEIQILRSSPTRYPSIHGGIGQSMSEPDAHFSEVLDGIESAIREFLSRRGVEVDVHVTLMPDEGSPWEPGDRITKYYNAKTHKVEATPAPKWLTQVKVRNEEGNYVKVPGADFCKIAPALHAEPDGPVMVHDSAKNIDFMMTHGFDFFRPGVGWKEISGFINRCGGLLFPSVGIGQIPAAAIGIVVFVLDTGVVLQGMKPYRSGRGRWPVVTYTTDAWTETTRDFLGEASYIAFQQLTGQWVPNIYGQTHFYVLGPRISRTSEDIGGELVLDTKKLSSVVSRRARVWQRDLTGTEINDLGSELTVNRYPYIEAKVNGIVAVDALSACAVPSFLSRPVGAMLRAIGFQGTLLSIRVTSAEAKALEAGTDLPVLYDYSWRVHDAVSEFAHSTSRIEILRF